MTNFIRIKEKIENAIGEGRPVPPLKDKIFHYYKKIETSQYAIYENCQYGDRVIAAYGNMVLLQKYKNKNRLTLYPYYQNMSIKKKIVLSEKSFPGLIKNSTIMQCALLPYMRAVGKNQFLKSVRLVIITDKAQIYHNYPARGHDCDGFAQPGDIVRFEESVVWDIPGRKYPVKNAPENATERYYPNLPEECYAYYPVLNTDNSFTDEYGNGGFGKQTYVTTGGKEVAVSRFYIHARQLQSNPFHFIGTGEKEYKMTLLATYRSNVDVGVRTCVFATSDGGRQWYCKYEFADMGEYDFRQGRSEAYGRNFGNEILNNGYDQGYQGGVFVKKRILGVPSKENKEPSDKIQWTEVGEVLTVCEDAQMTMRMKNPHGLHTGNIIALTGKLPRESKMNWMLNSEVAVNSAGNGLLFKVKVVDEYRISLYELVSSPDNHIPCRHIHHVNRIKDGWIFGTGEIYPNGWLFYFQLKGADTFTIVNAADEFPIIRLNSSQDSAQRTMGMILRDNNELSFMYASDHDCLSRKEYMICNGRTETFSRNSTGIFGGRLCDIDNRTKHFVVFEASEPCFYFQELHSMLLFCGQRGELGISFDLGKSWLKERIKEPIIHYYGSNGQRYFFDQCILVRK